MPSDNKQTNLNGKLQLLKEAFSFDSLKEKFTVGRKDSVQGSNIVKEVKKIIQEEEQYVHLQVGKSMWENSERDLRTQLWLSALQRKGFMSLVEKYHDYLDKGASPEAVSDIEKDVTRTFPNVYKFTEEDGQKSLQRVLQAYAAYDPEVAYCQGMNFLSGLLLLYLPSEAHAFATLVLLMEERGLRKFYCQNMSLLQVQLWQLSRLMSAKLNTHLESSGVLPVLFGASWFMTCFSSDFPCNFAARILDVLISESMDFPLLKVAVTILSSVEEKLTSLPGLEEILTYMKVHLPAWDERALHDMLSIAFSKPWTTRQLVILNSTDGAETVAEAFDRLALITPSLDSINSLSTLEEDETEEQSGTPHSVLGARDSVKPGPETPAPREPFKRHLSRSTTGSVVQWQDIPLLQPPPAPGSTIGSAASSARPSISGSSLLTTALVGTHTFEHSAQKSEAYQLVPALSSVTAGMKRDDDHVWGPFLANGSMSVHTERRGQHSLSNGSIGVQVEKQYQRPLPLRRLISDVGTCSCPGNGPVSVAVPVPFLSVFPSSTNSHPTSPLSRSTVQSMSEEGFGLVPHDSTNSCPAELPANTGTNLPRPMSHDVPRASFVQTHPNGDCPNFQAGQSLHILTASQPCYSSPGNILDRRDVTVSDARHRNTTSCSSSPRTPLGQELNPSHSLSSVSSSSPGFVGTPPEGGGLGPSGNTLGSQVLVRKGRASQEEKREDDALMAGIGIDILRAMTSTAAAAAAHGAMMQPVVFSSMEAHELHPTGHTPARKTVMSTLLGSNLPQPPNEVLRMSQEFSPRITPIEPVEPVLPIGPEGTQEDLGSKPEFTLRRPALYIDGIPMFDPKAWMRKDMEEEQRWASPFVSSENVQVAESRLIPQNSDSEAYVQDIDKTQPEVSTDVETMHGADSFIYLVSERRDMKVLDSEDSAELTSSAPIEHSAVIICENDLETLALQNDDLSTSSNSETQLQVNFSEFLSSYESGSYSANFEDLSMPTSDAVASIRVPTLQCPSFRITSEGPDLINVDTPAVKAWSTPPLIPQSLPTAQDPNSLMPCSPDSPLPVLSLNFYPELVTQSNPALSMQAVISDLQVTNANISMAGSSAQSLVQARVAGQCVELSLPSGHNGIAHLNFTVNVSISLTPNAQHSGLDSGLMAMAEAYRRQCRSTPGDGRTVDGDGTVAELTLSSFDRSTTTAGSLDAAVAYPAFNLAPKCQHSGLIRHASLPPQIQPPMFSSFARNPLPPSLIALLPELTVNSTAALSADSSCTSFLPLLSDLGPAANTYSSMLSTLPTYNHCPSICEASEILKHPSNMPPSSYPRRFSHAGDLRSPPSFVNSAGLSRLPSNDLDAAMLEQIEGFQISGGQSGASSLNTSLTNSMGTSKLSSLWMNATPEDLAAVGLSPSSLRHRRTSSGGLDWMVQSPQR